MHKHSLEAFEEITLDKSKQARLNVVLEVIEASKNPLRDWDVLQKLFPGASDMNLVRPRLTELHQMGKIIEGPPMANEARTRNVRTSVAVPKEQQQELAL